MRQYEKVLKKYVFYNIFKNSTKQIKIFFRAFSKPHKIYWCMAPYLISFKTWIAPFIERKSHFVKGAFPLRSNDNDKGPLIHDQNWKSSFHIVAVVVSRTKSLFLHMYLKMWSTIFLLLFKLEWNVWNWLAGKFLQPNRGFFFFNG